MPGKLRQETPGRQIPSGKLQLFQPCSIQEQGEGKFQPSISHRGIGDQEKLHQTFLAPFPAAPEAPGSPPDPCIPQLGTGLSQRFLLPEKESQGCGYGKFLEERKLQGCVQPDHSQGNAEIPQIHWNRTVSPLLPRSHRHGFGIPQSQPSKIPANKEPNWEKETWPWSEDNRASWNFSFPWEETGMDFSPSGKQIQVLIPNVGNKEDFGVVRVRRGRENTWKLEKDGSNRIQPCLGTAVSVRPHRIHPSMEKSWDLPSAAAFSVPGWESGALCHRCR